MLAFISSRLRGGAARTAVVAWCLLLASPAEAQNNLWTPAKKKPSTGPEPLSEYSLPGVNSDKNWLVLAHTTFAAALVLDSGYPLPAIKAGGATLVAATPTSGRFSIAGRLSGGIYAMDSSAGFVGGSVLVGAMLRAPKTRGRAGYVLVGPGVEYLPGPSRAWAGAHVVAGVVMRGFNIGGGLDVLGGDGIGMGLLTFHIGFGSLL